MERSELSPVSNFFHLKELFPQELFSLIDRLPFTTEGYTGAKNILVKKYGKHRLVAKAYVQNIMSLPISIILIPTRFMKTLETMGKLKKISGYVRLL